jgi:hypothetical protein
MPVKLSDVQNLNTGLCEVTLTGPDTSQDLTFEVKYNKNVPTELFIVLMDTSLLGKEFVALGNQIEQLAKQSSSDAKVAQLQHDLDSMKSRLNQLPKILSRIVIWQDVEGAEHPDLDFFAGIGLEKQIEYAAALVVAKSNPTTGSEPILPEPSTQKVSEAATPIKQDVLELPAGLEAEATGGISSMT